MFAIGASALDDEELGRSSCKMKDCEKCVEGGALIHIKHVPAQPENKGTRSSKHLMQTLKSPVTVVSCAFLCFKAGWILCLS